MYCVGLMILAHMIRLCSLYMNILLCMVMHHMSVLNEEFGKDRKSEQQFINIIFQFVYVLSSLSMGQQVK